MLPAIVMSNPFCRAISAAACTKPTSSSTINKERLDGAVDCGTEEFIAFLNETACKECAPSDRSVHLRWQSFRREKRNMAMSILHRRSRMAWILLASNHQRVIGIGFFTGVRMNIMDGFGLGQWLQRFGVEACERKLDERIEDSFPASDPPSFSPSFTEHGRLSGASRQANRAKRNDGADANQQRH